MWIAPDRVPPALLHDDFVLELLGPEHNDRDHAAWMSSIEHIRATPGFAPGDWGADDWPISMPLERNLADLVMHRAESDRGEAFAWSVLDPGGSAVIGCVYIDPDPTGACEAVVRSWVTARCADLDTVVVRAIQGWIGAAWPIATVRFPGR